MSRFDNAVKRGLIFSECLFGDPFTMDGKSYRGVFNEATVLEELGNGGFLERVVCSLLVRRDAFPPSLGSDFNNKEIFLRNRTYFINKVSSDRNSYTFELGDTNH